MSSAEDTTDPKHKTVPLWPSYFVTAPLLVIGAIVGLSSGGVSIGKGGVAGCLAALFLAKVFVRRKDWDLIWIRQSILEATLVPQLAGAGERISLGAWIGLVMLVSLCKIEVPKNGIRLIWIYAAPLVAFAILCLAAPSLARELQFGR